MSATDILYALDLMGTASFAFSGALGALPRKPDIIGLCILAGATAVGGGMIRDVTLGRHVQTLRDVNYILVVLGSVLVTVCFLRKLVRRERIFLYFDAVGLGVFSAIGTQIALDQEMNVLSVLFAACITGAGGGVIRDVLLGQMPVVLYREIYVLAVAIGAGGMMLVHYCGGQKLAGFGVAFTLTTTIRILALRYNWTLPRIGAGNGNGNDQGPGPMTCDP